MTFAIVCCKSMLYVACKRMLYDNCVLQEHVVYCKSMFHVQVQENILCYKSILYDEKTYCRSICRISKTIYYNYNYNYNYNVSLNAVYLLNCLMKMLMFKLCFGSKRLIYRKEKERRNMLIFNLRKWTICC